MKVAGGRRLWTCVKNDIRLQVRHGLYTIYLVISLLYVVILRSVSAGARDVLLPLLLFVDPTMLGFFFVGGIVLLERVDRTLSAMFTTPVRVFHYLAAKVISLSFLAVLASLVIAIFTVGIGHHLILLAAVVAVSAAIFTLLGLAAVTRFHTVNGYLIGSVLYMLPFALPLLGYFGLLSTPVLYLLPSKGSLDLIAASFRPGLPVVGIWAPSVLSLVFWIIASALWARRWFRLFALPKVGEV